MNIKDESIKLMTVDCVKMPVELVMHVACSQDMGFALRESGRTIGAAEFRSINYRVKFNSSHNSLVHFQVSVFFKSNCGIKLKCTWCVISLGCSDIFLCHICSFILVYVWLYLSFV